jgi:hypothetical protein
MRNGQWGRLSTAYALWGVGCTSSCTHRHAVPCCWWSQTRQPAMRGDDTTAAARSCMECMQRGRRAVPLGLSRCNPCAASPWKGGALQPALNSLQNHWAQQNAAKHGPSTATPCMLASTQLLGARQGPLPHRMHNRGAPCTEELPEWDRGAVLRHRPAAGHNPIGPAAAGRGCTAGPITARCQDTN